MRTLNFYISNPDSGDNQAAHPIFADGFGIVSERENGQIFFRNKLNNSLTFTAEDYTFIMAQPFDSVINVNLNVMEGGVVTMQWRGSFARTDCTINEVDKVLTVTPEVTDDYNAILDAMDVEFNLASLPIPQETPHKQIHVPPVLQIYFAGADIVSNYWQGEVWNTDVEPIGDGATLENMGFRLSGSLITGDGRTGYFRILHSTNGVDTVDDDYNINKIFKYYVNTALYNVGIKLVFSSATSATPTRWGEKYLNGAPTGTYYVQPVQSGLIYVPFYGLAWSTWSYWLEVDDTKTADIDDDMQMEDLKCAYPLDALLKGLLVANGLTIDFAADPQYSRILYGSGPIPITGWAYSWNLLFTAKSNILNLVDRNTEPASQVPCTLATVFNFLKNALNLYWTVESGNLRIEHLSYFKNGGTYSGTPATQYDLTQLVNPRSGKPWAWGQNQYSFEKYKVPQFVKWSWMDTTDEFFDGSGFECLSNYVQKGNTEEITVANITTNITRMILQPDTFSADGLAVLFTGGDGNVYTPFTRDIGGTWRVANGQLAMWELQTTFLLYDAPCDKIKVSNLVKSNVDYIRTKYNEVVFPALTVDTDQHIKTNVGDGEPETITNDLTSDSIKVKLKYLN